MAKARWSMTFFLAAALVSACGDDSSGACGDLAPTKESCASFEASLSAEARERSRTWTCNRAPAARRAARSYASAPSR